VTVALKGARFNPDNTQNLEGVYTNPDPNTYPVSSYSYMIVPTSESGPFTKEKGDVLGRFILYFVCAGQQKAEQLGYAPLPKVLVQNAFDAVRKIPGAPALPNIDTQCANPSIVNPPPPPPPPPSTTVPATSATTLPGGGSNGGGANGGGSNGGGANGGGATGSTLPGGVTDDTIIDADGNVVRADGTPVAAQPIAYASPVDYPAQDDPVPLAVYIMGVLALLVLVFGPPTVALQLKRRSSKP
jgi:phosphate transport system substrate-binding protein